MHFFSTVFKFWDFYGRVEIETYDIYVLSKSFSQRKKIQNGGSNMSTSEFNYDFTLSAIQRQRRGRGKIMSLLGCLIIVSPLASHCTGCLIIVNSLASHCTGCLIIGSPLASRCTKCLFIVNPLAFHYTGCLIIVNPLASHYTGCLIIMSPLASHSHSDILVIFFSYIDCKNINCSFHRKDLFLLDN